MFFFSLCRVLKEISHDIAVLVKTEVDAALALVDHGSKLAIKVRAIYLFTKARDGVHNYEGRILKISQPNPEENDLDPWNVDAIPPIKHFNIFGTMFLKFLLSLRKNWIN